MFSNKPLTCKNHNKSEADTILFQVHVKWKLQCMGFHNALPSQSALNVTLMYSLILHSPSWIRLKTNAHLILGTVVEQMDIKVLALHTFKYNVQSQVKTFFTERSCYYV